MEFAGPWDRSVPGVESGIVIYPTPFYMPDHFPVVTLPLRNPSSIDIPSAAPRRIPYRIMVRLSTGTSKNPGFFPCLSFSCTRCSLSKGENSWRMASV